tara:strand:- start:599 stop:880 length:282 start_codon:yes stop_codon:yes gene_type:complete
MTFAQYLKIETGLGGIGCTDKQFIQECLAYILPQAKHHHLYRTARHLFIRDGLVYLNKARRLAFETIPNRENNLPPCEGELKQAWYLNEISKL